MTDNRPERFESAGNFGKIVTSQNSATNTILALTNKPVSEVYMATASLPKTKSFRKSHALEYRCYESAKQRCDNPRNARFHQYGGRGIRFCFESFAEFLAEVGRRPSLKYSLDRIDVNGNYEAGNVRWATPEEQQRNRRNNHVLVIDGVSKTVTGWAEIYSIQRRTVFWRLDSGWCVKCAVTKPVSRLRSVQCAQVVNGRYGGDKTTLANPSDCQAEEGMNERR